MSEKTRVELESGEVYSTLRFYNSKANSLNSEMLSQMKKFVEHVKSPLLLIESEGDGAFCAGASFVELKQAKSEQEAVQLFRAIAEFLYTLLKSPALSICTVQGAAVGGGVGLVAACDYAIGSSECRFKLSELNVGLTPAVIMPVLKHRIGATAFGHMALDRLWRDPQWALAHGLLAEVSSRPAAEAERLLDGFGGVSVAAMKELKKQIGTDCHTQILAGAELSGRLYYENLAH